jgi:serine/threonine protein phosphatase PrpC
VGDSRGVLGRRCPESGAWQALDLTYDHKPTAAGEKERILRSQGRVER